MRTVFARHKWEPYIWILPSILLMLIFVVFPIGIVFRLAFSEISRAGVLGEFNGLKNFIDVPIKNYSSGMQVRLAFSIAIRARGDILLLDEVLAVGDAAFQQKCNDYFASLKDKKQTVILVTHSMESVKKYCTRAILIEDGKITKNGDPKEVANEYTKLLSR